MLRIFGNVETEVALDIDDLRNQPAEHQVPDISRLDERRKGDAIKLVAVLEIAKPKPSACQLIIRSTGDGFERTVSLPSICERGLLIYQMDGQHLDAQVGGPLRLFIPDHSDCGKSELDACANVKFLDELEVI